MTRRKICIHISVQSDKLSKNGKWLKTFQRYIDTYLLNYHIGGRLNREDVPASDAGGWLDRRET